MKALITGASSGLGYEFAKILSKKGYDLILVARRKERLEKIKKQLNTNVEIIDLDLSINDNCIKLYNMVENLDVVINNAGFGKFGSFNKTELNDEIEMIDLNVKAVHTLTKLFLVDFIKKDKGYILNVASSAGFIPGPLMATYYATKAYVLSLTQSIYGELKKNNSNVYIGALCPGPVNTEFNEVANVKFSLKGISSYDVAKYAINKMFKRKLIIIPGTTIKLGVLVTRFIPRKLLIKISSNIQSKKH